MGIRRSCQLCLVTFLGVISCTDVLAECQSRGAIKQILTGVGKDWPEVIAPKEWGVWYGDGDEGEVFALSTKNMDTAEGRRMIYELSAALAAGRTVTLHQQACYGETVLSFDQISVE